MTEGEEVHGTASRDVARREDAVRGSGAEAMRYLTSLPVVDLTIDGVEMLAVFEPDEEEHTRRSDLNVGAVTSTALLHGLWLLPSGVPVPVDEIPDHKRHRLERATHLVDVTDAGFERLYCPPGAVRAVAFGGTRMARSLHRAAQFTPIVQRFAVWDGLMRPSVRVLATAEARGVGLVEFVDGATSLLLAPAVAEKGVPAVYRWWIAELAYSSWLYDNTQPVS